jgi:hypothetical protein
MVGGIIPEWVGFPKAEPRIARNAPGLLMSRRGVGGWGVSATVVEIIGSPYPTAKSSVGHRVSGAANEGVVHEEGL